MAPQTTTAIAAFIIRTHLVGIVYLSAYGGTADDITAKEAVGILAVSYLIGEVV